MALMYSGREVYVQRFLDLLPHFSTRPVSQQCLFHIDSAHAFMHRPFLCIYYREHVCQQDCSDTSTVKAGHRTLSDTLTDTRTHFIPCCILYFYCCEPVEVNRNIDITNIPDTWLIHCFKLVAISYGALSILSCIGRSFFDFYFC